MGTSSRSTNSPTHLSELPLIQASNQQRCVRRLRAGNAPGYVSRVGWRPLFDVTRPSPGAEETLKLPEVAGRQCGLCIPVSRSVQKVRRVRRGNVTRLPERCEACLTPLRQGETDRVPRRSVLRDAEQRPCVLLCRVCLPPSQEGETGFAPLPTLDEHLPLHLSHSVARFWSNSRGQPGEDIRKERELVKFYNVEAWSRCSKAAARR